MILENMKLQPITFFMYTNFILFFLLFYPRKETFLCSVFVYLFKPKAVPFVEYHRKNNQ